MRNYFAKRRIANNSIKLYWFRRDNPTELNFGDELSCEIVKNLSGKEIRRADIENCDMVAIGSVLEPVLMRKNQNKIVVWGAGLMFGERQTTYDRSINDIRLVRGKLSAQRLGLDQRICGDPGLLASLFYKPSNNKKKITVVPHYMDRKNPVIAQLSENKAVKIINVYDTPSKVISEIASSELVVSSSLHGIIIAHSFGIPAYWAELSDDVAGGGYKFRDHYSVFGLEPLRISATQLGEIEKEADRLIGDCQPLLQLEKIKKDLVKTFPHEI